MFIYIKSLHSSTWLPSDIEPKRAADVLKTQRDSLMLLLRHMLPSITSMLYSKSIIHMIAYEETMDERKVPSVRTAFLLSTVEDRIRAEPHVFIEFVKILESEPTLRLQANLLVKEYLSVEGIIYVASIAGPACTPPLINHSVYIYNNIHPLQNNSIRFSLHMHAEDVGFG